MSNFAVVAEESSPAWTTTQIYVLAAICFFVGIPAGYFLHAPAQASMPVSAVTAPAAQQVPSGMGAGQVTPEQLRHMAETSAAPVLAELKNKPNDRELVVKAGNIFYDAQQYPVAIKYYEEALKLDPKDANVRTDLGTAYYYLGDADRALTEISQSLKDQPNHAQSLLNLGLIKWQSKMDINGAVVAWQKLLDTNPNYEQAPMIKQMIAQAKQHANIKPGTKTHKSM
jgi:cytochrome c-type biogenesis protein CcmH/NrfG